MGRRYILATTLTRHFICFAKLMGFYPKIRSLYKEICDLFNEMHLHQEDDIMLFSKGSFDRYVDISLRDRLGFCVYLNEPFIRNTYFFGGFGYKRFKESEVNELIDLFFAYLGDKKIYRKESSK